MKPWLCIGIIVFCFIGSASADTLDRRITIERSRGSVYEMLNRISERSQLLFIYEKGIVNNDHSVRIATGTYTLREAILKITGEEDLQMRVIGSHILLYKERQKEALVSTADSLFSGKVVEGYIIDRQTREAISSCYVAVEGAGMGTVSNSDGRFALKVPDTLSNARIVISHIGYRSTILPLSVVSGIKSEICLDPVAIQLQEVVVRYVPAQKIVREMLDHRSKNYSKEPACFTSFYREGVEYGQHFVSLTEGVCQIYKTGFGATGEDQVKLLKMRNIRNPRYPDSILVKIQAGVRSSLLLDIINHTSDFLSHNRDNEYNFTRTGMERIDSGRAHVIAFEQKPEVKEPLFTGKLYIDADNWALVKAEFEVNPRYIRQVSPNFILRKSKNLDIEAHRVAYTVTYQQWSGHYWVSHVRGDLQFKVKRKKGLFGSAHLLNAFFEMVTCKIDTNDVKRFPNRERLPTGQIFSQTHFAYDSDFWEQFNTIVPEQKITEAIAKLLLTIEKHEEPDLKLKL